MKSAALALAAALVACAGPAPEAPAPAPAASPAPAAPSAPLSPERARFEEWKRTQGGGDPRETFARAAEAEAERRRQEALAGGGVPAPTSAVETEMLEDRLRELGTSGGCLDERPDLSEQEDWITHRALTRDDFRSEQKQDVKPVVDLPSFQAGAYVVIRFVCIARARLSEPQPGLFIAEVDDVEYLALLSRWESWWNPESLGHDEWILRHEQLHFDVAELFVQELTRSAPARRAQLRGTGPDPHAAIEALTQVFAVHMLEQRERFWAFEEQYDRETRHGNDLERQTEWYARVKRGLGAVRAGLDVPPTLDRPAPPG